MDAVLSELFDEDGYAADDGGSGCLCEYLSTRSRSAYFSILSWMVLLSLLAMLLLMISMGFLGKNYSIYKRFAPSSVDIFNSIIRHTHTHHTTTITPNPQHEVILNIILIPNNQIPLVYQQSTRSFGWDKSSL